MFWECLSGESHQNPREIQSIWPLRAAKFHVEKDVTAGCILVKLRRGYSNFTVIKIVQRRAVHFSIASYRTFIRKIHDMGCAVRQRQQNLVVGNVFISWYCNDIMFRSSPRLLAPFFGQIELLRRERS